MKRYFFIILLLAATRSAAQPPVIDSMFVDESKSTLSISGDFGTWVGKVWVDSVELPIVSWTDTNIIATIPGFYKRGFAGPVIVGGRGYQSEPGMLTAWDITFLRDYTMGQGGHYLDLKQNVWIIDWRMDFESRHRQFKTLGKRTASVIMSGSLTYTHNIYDYLPPYYSESDGNSASGLGQGTMDLSTLTFKINCDSFVNGSFSGDHVDLQTVLDSSLNLQIDPNYQTYGGLSSNVYFPPTNTFTLLHTPQLISITNDSLIHSDSINFLWHPLPNITSYRLQISDSENFNTLLIDTVTTDTSLTILAPRKNGEFYWRVSGLNSDGQSRWSSTWDFMLVFESPFLISPRNGSIFSGVRIPLSWNPEADANHYILQYSTDSTFVSATTINSIAPSSWVLNNLDQQTTYYWRAGYFNSDGQMSRWSDTWHFTTGSLSSVHTSSEENVSVQCYPNPAANEITISLSVTENTSLLVLYDLQGRIVKQENTTHQAVLTWDVSNVANGTYLLDCISSGKSQVANIVIAH